MAFTLAPIALAQFTPPKTIPGLATGSVTDESGALVVKARVFVALALPAGTVRATLRP